LANYGFDLQRKNNAKNKKKRKFIFVCAFLCFTLILGSVSFLLLWKSLDYDFNNFFHKSDETTDAVQTTAPPTSRASYSGNYRFLLAVTSDDLAQLRFVNLVDIDLSEKTIKIIPVDLNLKNAETKESCSSVFKNKGIKELGAFIGAYYGTDVSRYISVTDTGYKSIFRILGNITVNISEDIEYDTPDMFLEMFKGQNELTPEKTYKYMKYICETKKGYECSELNARIIEAAFVAFYTSDNFVDGDSLFSQLINQTQTDISIVDYTNAKDEMQSLLPQTSKDKLKVFVYSNRP